jgi:hypothetical protein
LPFEREAVEKEIHVVDRDGQVHKGAQGILKIAAQYRGLGLLEKIGAVPLVRSLLPIATDSLRPAGASCLARRAAFTGSRSF